MMRTVPASDTSCPESRGEVMRLTDSQKHESSPRALDTSARCLLDIAPEDLPLALDAFRQYLAILREWDMKEESDGSSCEAIGCRGVGAVDSGRVIPES